MVRNCSLARSARRVAMVAVVAVGLIGQCLAQGAPGDGSGAPPPAATTPAEPTKEKILEQLKRITDKLEQLKFVSPEGAKAAVLERRMKAAEREAGLEALEALDTRELLGPVTQPAESGVERLQRHQRELTTQKLGDQLIILDENP